MEQCMSKTDTLAKIIWDYHKMNHIVEKADVIIALGSHDVRVAERAAQLYLEGYAGLLICSGFLGNFTEGVWQRSEAEIFAEIAVNLGVPEDRILIEKQSTNTGDNILFSKKLLADQQINVNRVIAVQKPYMERRTYATYMKNYPDDNVFVTSPQITYEEYPNESISKESLINIMIGDLHRIHLYPKRGFQIEQEIPVSVWTAFHELVQMGYDKHLLGDSF